MTTDYFASTGWVILAIVFTLIILDIIAGIVKGIISKSLQSEMMWLGLVKKTSYILIIAVAIIIDFGASYLELPFGIKLFEAASIFIILTEVCSILENTTIINPNLKASKLFSIFGISKDETDN